MGIRKITPGEATKLKALQSGSINTVTPKRKGTPAGRATNAPRVSVGKAIADRPQPQAPKPTNVTPRVTIGTAYGQGASGSGSVVIQELTGDKRTITLSGRALPYKPIVFAGQHRIEEIETAGFSSTGQQPTGAKELPSTWKGAWKTRHLGDRDERYAQVDGGTSEIIDGIEAISVSSNQVGSAAELAELIDDVRRKGQLLRVSWLHLVRIGRLSTFTQEWQTAHDVDWQMEFKWTGKDETAPAATSSESNLSSITQQVSKAYMDLERATEMDAIGDDLDPTAADMIDAGVGRIWRGVQDIEGAITARVSAVTDPIDSLRHAMVSMTALRDEAELFQAELGARVAPSYILVTDPFDLSGVPAGRALAAAVSRQLGIRSARAMKHRAARQRHAALKALDANLLAVVLCKEEQDLRVLARIYYGNVEDWHIIRAFNGFAGSIVPLGTVVLIPVKEPA